MEKSKVKMEHYFPLSVEQEGNDAGVSFACIQARNTDYY